MKYYYHPKCGFHIGSPIGGDESSEVTESEFYTGITENSLSIEDVSKNKLLKIQTEKNSIRDGGFTYDGVLYDSDSEARLAYLELSTQLSIDPTYSTPWKASTGQWVTMNLELFNQVLPAYKAHIESCFTWQAQKEQEIAVAVANNSIEELNTVSTTCGE